MLLYYFWGCHLVLAWMSIRHANKRETYQNSQHFIRIKIKNSTKQFLSLKAMISYFLPGGIISIEYIFIIALQA